MLVPAITIGIMTYNYGRYISQAIQSILIQNFNNWELIISDDASNDDTENIVAPYLSDPRIKYIKHSSNLGQARNWAFLLKSGTAPIVAILHADDYWLQGIVERSMEAFQDENTDIVYFNFYRKVKDEPALKMGPNKKDRYATGMQELMYQLEYNTFLPSMVFLRRNLVNIVDPPDTTLNLAVDNEYFYRACMKAKFVTAIHSPLLIYRVHPNSASHLLNSSKERENFVHLVTKQILKLPASKAFLKKFYKRITGDIIISAISEIEQGNTDTSLKFLKKAFSYNKEVVFNVKFISILIIALTGKMGRKSLLMFRHLKKKSLNIRS